MSFEKVETLIAELQQGRMILLVDDEHRENEGDLIVAAEFVTSEKINFMITHARGLVCLALAPEIVDRLELPLMVPFDKNGAPNKTAFTVSIEASSGISTGISAADRALTIQVAANPHAKPSDISTPGHIFPLKARAGGVLERPGHTEASVDYMKLAGLTPAAAICEVMNEDGTMARLPDLIRFANKHQLKIGTIHDLIENFRREQSGKKTSEDDKKTQNSGQKNQNRDRNQSI
jgi:3,4-dihydroxy 2-butanone 4-phosphate synthase/GTP cyclohydrolase II